MIKKRESAESIFYKKIFSPLYNNTTISDEEINKYLKEVEESLRKEGVFDESKWREDSNNFMDSFPKKDTRMLKQSLSRLLMNTTKFATLFLKDLVEKANEKKDIIKDKRVIVFIAPTGKKYRKKKYI